MSIYNTKSSDTLQQGDICQFLPKIVPELLIPPVDSEGVWTEYLRTIKAQEKKLVKFTTVPIPTTSVILTQTCAIENAKESDYLLCAELYEHDLPNYIQSAGKGKKRERFEIIFHTIRHDPALLFFPELSKEGKKYGPWLLDLRSLFLVPSRLIKKNLLTFWLAGIKNDALELFKDKIKTFFARLAYDEILLLNTEEWGRYLTTISSPEQEKTLRDARKRLGFSDYDLELET